MNDEHLSLPAELATRIADRTRSLFPSASLRDAVLRDVALTKGASRDAAPRSGAMRRKARRAPGLAWALAGLVPAALAMGLAIFLTTHEGDRASRRAATTPARDDAAVAAARARNRAAYERERAQLHRDHPGKWVALAVPEVGDARPTGETRATWLFAVGATVEEVLGFGKDAPHRYVFRVGDEGDLAVFVSAWYGARFAGSGGIAQALGVDLVLHEAVDVEKDDRSARFSGETPFPSVAFHLEAPDGRASPRNGDATPEVFVGTLGPDLMLTPQDDVEMGLERFEVPGTATVGEVPCRRVLVTASIPRVGARGMIVACVPDVPAARLAAMARARHTFWQWPQNLRDALHLEGRPLVLPGHAPPAQTWIVFANNRVIARGANAAQALAAADGYRDVVYQRYVTTWPMADASADPAFANGFDIEGGARVELVLGETRLAGTVPSRSFHGELTFPATEHALHATAIVVLDAIDDATWVRAGLALGETPVAPSIVGAPADAPRRAAFARGRVVRGGVAGPVTSVYVIAPLRP